MKLLQKRSVAIIITAVVILLMSVVGITKAPAKLPDVQAGQWVYDGAGVLSDEQEQYLTQGNAALMSQHGAVIAVATMKNVKGWNLWDFCMDLAEKWGLSAQDMILVLDIKGDNYWLVQGSGLVDSFTDDMAGQYARQHLENDFAAKNYGAGVISLFDALTAWYGGGSAVLPGAGNSYYDGSDYDDPYDSTPSTEGRGGAAGMLILVIILIIVALIIWDAARYNRYRRRGLGTTVVYHPFIFGRPRRPRTPPPPPPGGPRPPSGGSRRPPSPPPGGTRPPSGGTRPPSGGARPSGGFSRPSGGASRPSGGFSRPSGGASRPSGGFSRPSGGGRSGGSFGGGRSGGSFGGGRSGGFGGGRR